MSFRYDLVVDRQRNVQLRGEETSEESVGYFSDNDWGKSTFKLAVSLGGYRRDLLIDSYMSFGMNTKFPTLFQQVSSPGILGGSGSYTSLHPERNRSVELSINIARDIRDHTSIYGWRVSGSFFQNTYDNKFRVLMTPGIPILFYDNVPDARISGFETKSSVYLLHKKVTLEFGASRYFISEKAAFPFKSDRKMTITGILDHKGYSFQVHWFREGGQAGWIRYQGAGAFVEVTLPDYTNLDAHLSKTFHLGRLKLLINASGRNLLGGEEVILQGLAIRDRRYYLTVGAEY